MAKNGQIKHENLTDMKEITGLQSLLDMTSKVQVKYQCKKLCSPLAVASLRLADLQY